MKGAAVVLLSGGQDSATCLAWALERYERVETIGFDYGQRWRVELAARAEILRLLPNVRPAWRDRLGPDHLVTISLPTMEGERFDDLPSTFIPGRNLIFFTYAAIIAERARLKYLIGGMCETDFSGYPDCRDNTLKSLQVTLNLGMAEKFSIETPLMWLTKAETWHLAAELGGEKLVDVIHAVTHTCYAGSRELQSYGHGCGACDACKLRSVGWMQFCKDQRS